MWGHRGICAGLVNIPLDACIHVHVYRSRLNAAQSATERASTCALEVYSLVLRLITPVLLFFYVVLRQVL